MWLVLLVATIGLAACIESTRYTVLVRRLYGVRSGMLTGWVTVAWAAEAVMMGMAIAELQRQLGLDWQQVVVSVWLSLAAIGLIWLGARRP